eukprot:Rhum_TRINITY_DN34_c0_g1::Rhum_TRINITY_DN34_c0_g1_i1::g.91::m.91/K20724/TMEM33; transmembrane protein 33
MDVKDVNMYGHAVIVVLFLAWLFPLYGIPYCYNLAMYAGVLVSGYTVKANYGVPSLESFSFSNWRESLYPVQVWASKLMTGTEVHFLLFTFIWMSQPPNFLVVLVLARRSVWSVGTALATRYPDSKVYSLVGPAWLSLKAREMQVLQQVTLFEIMLGFLCIVNIAASGLPGLMSCYMQWSFLKVRYHSPDQSRPTKPAVLHRVCWQGIGMKVQPLLNAVPILNTPVSFATNWFKTVQ